MVAGWGVKGVRAYSYGCRLVGALCGLACTKYKLVFSIKFVYKFVYKFDLLRSAGLVQAIGLHKSHGLRPME